MSSLVCLSFRHEYTGDNPLSQRSRLLPIAPDLSEWALIASRGQRHVCMFDLHHLEIKYFDDRLMLLPHQHQHSTSVLFIIYQALRLANIYNDNHLQPPSISCTVTATRRSLHGSLCDPRLGVGLLQCLAKITIQLWLIKADSSSLATFAFIPP